MNVKWIKIGKRLDRIREICCGPDVFINPETGEEGPAEWVVHMELRAFHLTLRASEKDNPKLFPGNLCSANPGRIVEIMPPNKARFSNAGVLTVTILLMEKNKPLTVDETREAASQWRCLMGEDDETAGVKLAVEDASLAKVVADAVAKGTRKRNRKRGPIGRKSALENKRWASAMQKMDKQVRSGATHLAAAAAVRNSMSMDEVTPGTIKRRYAAWAKNRIARKKP